MVIRAAGIGKLLSSAGVGRWLEAGRPTSPLVSPTPTSTTRRRRTCDDEMEVSAVGLSIIIVKNMDKSHHTIIHANQPPKSITTTHSHVVVDDENENENEDEDETYTIVTRHHLLPNTRKLLVYDQEDGLINKASLFDISPALPPRVDHHDHHFLSTCHQCNKLLHGKDIYMYRGEKAFCSTECRSMEIVAAQMLEHQSMRMTKKHDYCSNASTSQQEVSRDGIFAI